MARTIFRIVFIILLWLTFYQIFQFSNENATESSSTSKGIMRKIINIFPYTKNLSISTKESTFFYIYIGWNFNYGICKHI